LEAANRNDTGQLGGIASDYTVRRITPLWHGRAKRRAWEKEKRDRGRMLMAGEWVEEEEEEGWL